MILYKTLEKTSTETLHETFIEAFSDYQVKMDLPFWKFQGMIQRRGYTPDLSIGAFENEKLVGFALNGLRQWNGKATVYDIATGVAPEYRRQGITSSIFLHIRELLKDKKAEQYLLEAIKSNEPAIQLYRKQGFEIQREFSCFLINRDKFIPKAGHKVEKVNGIDFEEVKGFPDFYPSWQNSAESIEAVSETFAYFVVRLDNVIAGYGIIDEMTGDIPQLAVARAHRGKGIAGSIMAELVKAAKSERAGVLNVEAQLEPISNFLINSGFEYHVGQFEMLLKL